MGLSARLALPLAAGAAAGRLREAYAGESAAVFAVATAVAALVSALPFVLAVEAPRTFALRRLSARARGPLRVRLLRAVALHRRVERLDLPSRTQRRIERGFEELAVRLERRLDRSASRADPALQQAVDQLERWVRAVRSRDALLDGLELSASPVSTDSEALEAEVAALAALEGGAPRPHG